MRPCRRCRAPIENRDATCPRCGSAQDAAPKPNTDPAPPRSRRRFARELLTGFADFGILAAPLVPIVLAVPLAVLGAVGYFIAGQSGAAVGVVAAIAVLIGIAIWAESGG